MVDSPVTSSPVLRKNMDWLDGSHGVFLSRSKIWRCKSKGVTKFNSASIYRGGAIVPDRYGATGVYEGTVRLEGIDYSVGRETNL